MKHILTRGFFLAFFLYWGGRLLYAAPNDGVRAASPVAAVADVHRGALMWQEYACRRYTTADGLPSVLNERVLQDSKGYIWICGTSGLSRFDGFSFKTFLEGSFANLYSIGETESGAVYAISDRFIYVYDSAEDTLKRVSRFSKTGMTVFSSTLLPSGYCISYEKADDGDQSFCKITDNGIEKLFTHPDFREYPDANRAWYARAKNLLYLPLTNGISVFDGAEKVAFHEGINARCFVEYREALWAITGEAMYRLNADGNFELKVELNIGDNNEYMLARAGTDGTLLFSDYSTIYRYDGRKIEKIFSANIIKDFIVDRENNIWAVTYEGVYNLFDLQFRNLFLADRTDNVRSVVYDSLHNRVIMGTLNGKLLEVCEGKYAELPCPPNPLTPENRFMPNGAVIGDAVYMPSLGGFVKIRGGLCSWVSFPDRTYPFQFTVPFSDGAVLTGGYNYLLISTLNGKIVKTYSPENLKNRIYSRPCIDRHNRIWIGGGNGLNMIEGDSIEAFFDDSLAYCRVMTIDDDCNVWFASENRLYKISDADITKKYVFDNQITNIHFTKSGILVVSTLDKIHIFNKSLESHVYFDSQNGFTGLEPMRGNFAEDGAGNLYLPAIESVCVFNPDRLLGATGKKSVMQLTNVSASRDNVKWNTLTDTHLSYRQKNLRFAFIGLSYTAAQNVRYHYRLLGFQNSWSEPTALREVTFNNLPYGDYTFEIYADAGTADSRSETVACSFSIKPAFWQTTWFWAVTLIALMALSALMAIAVMRRRNRALLERLNTERELNELRIRSIRLKAIPHFNANVLASIEYYMSNRTKEEALHILGVYSNFLVQTLREVDKAARPLADELEYVQMYLELEKLRFGDRFDFRIDVADDVNRAVQVPTMALHTYCENALKHGLSGVAHGGHIVVQAVRHGTHVCVSVADNGAGRAAAQNRPVHSTKQGLQILTRQIEIYNRFNICHITQHVEDLYSDGLPAGTRFSILVPENFSYAVG